MAITYRNVKGSELTHAELDANFTELDQPRDTSGIADGAISNIKIADGNVDESALATNAANGRTIATGGIESSDFDSGAITTSKITSALEVNDTFTIDAGATITNNGTATGFGFTNSSSVPWNSNTAALPIHIWHQVASYTFTATGKYLVSAQFGRVTFPGAQGKDCGLRVSYPNINTHVFATFSYWGGANSTNARSNFLADYGQGVIDATSGQTMYLWYFQDNSSNTSLSFTRNTLIITRLT